MAQNRIEQWIARETTRSPSFGGVPPALSASVGGVLLVAGLRRRGLAGAVLVASGGGLLGHAVTQWLSVAGAEVFPPLTVIAPEEPIFDIVQEASEELFPASDAPGWR